MAIRYKDGQEDGITEDLVCSLEKPMEADNLSDSEKAAIQYGELFATNHLAINDDIYDNLRKYFNESEIVELSMTVAFFVGLGRLAASYHLVEELPDSFQADEKETLTPWGNESCLLYTSPSPRD